MEFFFPYHYSLSFRDLLNCPHSFQDPHVEKTFGPLLKRCICTQIPWSRILDPEATSVTEKKKLFWLSKKKKELVAAEMNRKTVYSIGKSIQGLGFFDSFVLKNIPLVYLAEKNLEKSERWSVSRRVVSVFGHEQERCQNHRGKNQNFESPKQLSILRVFFPQPKKHKNCISKPTIKQSCVLWMITQFAPQICKHQCGSIIFFFNLPRFFPF